jgi:hypothetical protein
MAHVRASEHVDACRAVFHQLLQVEAHEKRSAMALPIDLQNFLREFHEYIEWAGRNDVSVTEALRRALTMMVAS